MFIPLIVVGAVLLLFLIILALPVHVTLTAKDKVKLEWRLLFYRKEIPLRRNPNKKKKHYKKQKKTTKIPALDRLIDEASLREELRLVRGLLSLIVRRKYKWLRLRTARLHIRVATGDAATTAVAYGAVSQSVAYLLALLDRITRLRAREPEVSITADFLGEHSAADVKLVLTLHVFDALAAEYRLWRDDIKERKKDAQKQDTAACKKGASL